MRRRIVIHCLAHARAALGAAANAGVGVTLESPAAAAGYQGIGWWRELLALATGEFPALDFDAVLDCGAAPGHALAALRGGIKAVRLRGDHLPPLADIAAALGGTLLGPAAGNEALDLLDIADIDAACRTWLER